MSDNNNDLPENIKEFLNQEIKELKLAESEESLREEYEQYAKDHWDEYKNRPKDVNEEILEWIPRRIAFPYQSEEEFNGPYAAELKYAVLTREHYKDHLPDWLSDRRSQSVTCLWSSIVLIILSLVIFYMDTRLTHLENEGWYTFLALAVFAVYIVASSVLLGSLFENGMIGIGAGIVITIIFSKFVSRPFVLPVMCLLLIGAAIFKRIQYSSSYASFIKTLSRNVKEASDAMFSSFASRLNVWCTNRSLLQLSDEDDMKRFVEVKTTCLDMLETAKEDLSDWTVSLSEDGFINIEPVYRKGNYDIYTKYDDILSDEDPSEENTELSLQVGYDDEIDPDDYDEKDPEQFDLAYKNACDGSVYSMYFIAFCYMNGKIKKQDISKAMIWAEIAARNYRQFTNHHSFSYVFYYLALFYLDGCELIHRDKKKALSLLETGKYYGSEEAENKLAELQNKR